MKKIQNMRKVFNNKIETFKKPQAVMKIQQLNYKMQNSLSNRRKGL